MTVHINQVIKNTYLNETVVQNNYHSSRVGWQGRFDMGGILLGSLHAQGLRDI